MPKNYFPFIGKTGFDNERYIDAQSEAIIVRASKFDKLYLEFGGKLLYDYHAARVLPGYHFGAKMEVIKRLAEKRQLEFLFCVNARDLQRGKKMGALGITYRDFSLKMIDSIEDHGFRVPAIAINLFSGEPVAKKFGFFLRKNGYEVHYRGLIKNYPDNISVIASPRGYGKKPFIKTKKPIVIVTGAGPNSGKMATCLAMIYQDYLRRNDSGYAKFESFPVWNLPLSSPINAAYEAATADIGDYNLIDPYHLKAYGAKTVNYNRDVEGFVIIQKMLKKIISGSNYMHNYHSPTDMGINKMSEGIVDLNLCEKAAKQEIIRRFFNYRSDLIAGMGSTEAVFRVEKLMKKMKISLGEREVAKVARTVADAGKGHRGIKAGAALMLPNGKTVAGGNSPLMHAESAVLIKGLKILAGVGKEENVLWPEAIEQVRKLRREAYSDESENLSVPEILIVLSISASRNKDTAKLFAQLGNLHSSELHATHVLSREDAGALRKLGIHFTSDGKREVGKLYFS